MYQLSMCNENDKVMITKLDLMDEEKSRFSVLGFDIETEIIIVSKIGKNLIILLKDSTCVLVGGSTAMKIYVEEKRELIRKFKKKAD